VLAFLLFGVLLFFQRENIGKDDNRIASSECQQHSGRLQANCDQGVGEQASFLAGHPGICDSPASFLYENPGADHRRVPVDLISYNADPFFYLPETLVGAYLYHKNGQAI